MAFNKGVRDHLACLGNETKQRMISEKDFFLKNPNSVPATKRAHTRKPSQEIDLFQRTVTYVVKTICDRHPKLNELKEKFVVPVANKKVTETLSRMEKGNVLTAHDVELLTTAVYKASLDEMSLKVHAPSYDGKPRAVSNP